VRLFGSLPKSREAQVIGNQVLRSGTSVGAQFAEALRAKSRPDFINKVVGATQELEETAYWLDLLAASGVVKGDKLKLLCDETNELIAIFTTMVKRTRSNTKQLIKE
jgi:four helix bundle protein